MTERQMSG